MLILCFRLHCIPDRGRALHWSLRVAVGGVCGTAGIRLHAVTPAPPGARLCQAFTEPLAKTATEAGGGPTWHWANRVVT